MAATFLVFQCFLFSPTLRRIVRYILPFTLLTTDSKLYPLPKMHAEMRRVPAERARHAKRLGHVQVGSGAAFPVLAGAHPGDENGTTTTVPKTTTPASSQAAPVPISVVLSSSSALSSPSTALSSAPSSATTPPTSSVVSATGSQTPTTPVSPSSLVTPSTALTSTSPNFFPTSTPQTNAGAVTHSGLSGGAIAGIIAGAAIVGTALVVFFVRKTYLRRRERKRISWSGAPGVGAGIFDEPKPLPDTNEQPASFTSAAKTPRRIAPPSPFEPHGQSMYSTPVSPTAHMQIPSFPTYVVPTPPPATYNNPTPVAAYPTRPVPSGYGPGDPAPLATTRIVTATGVPSILTSPRAQYSPMQATVKCTFVPTLPDELSITTGERVLIIEEYDDGWGLCANVRGERGMVPRECLERAPINQSAIGWRNVGRTSSLNLDGKRF